MQGVCEYMYTHRERASLLLEVTLKEKWRQSFTFFNSILHIIKLFPLQKSYSNMKFSHVRRII